MHKVTPLNIEIAETLRRRVKANAALEGVTVSEFASRALTQYVDQVEQNRTNGDKTK